MALARRVLFWCHLVGGVLASAIILIMSLTGVALTYQRQMQLWADTANFRAAPTGGAATLSVPEIASRVPKDDPESEVASVTLRRDPTMPAAVAIGGKTIYVNPYTGHVHGEGQGGRTRRFFSSMVRWHRYIALTGAWRPFGKAVTGASNLIFLFLVLTGLYLWLPRVWTWTQLRSVLWFRRTATPKARDFNWHNVIGFWSAIPLAIVVGSATVISYPWASNLVYRAAGEAPPAPAGRGRGGQAATAIAGDAARRAGGSGPSSWDTGARGHASGASGDPDALDLALAQARARVPDWQILTVRLPTNATAPIAVTVDAGDGGQPQLRGTLTIDPHQPGAAAWEHFDDQSTGRRWRSWLRFAHTGEAYGLTGQTVAGAVSAGGVFLVWTGIALTLRRFGARRRRNARGGAR